MINAYYQILDVEQRNQANYLRFEFKFKLCNFILWEQTLLIGNRCEQISQAYIQFIFIV